MKRSLTAYTLVALVLLATKARAQNNYDAKWIWADAGNPSVEAPAGKVWFRHEVRTSGPSTGLARVLADDPFVFWVNGQRVGDGEGGKLYRFNLNGIVERGPNIIAVETENKGGKAGLFVDGEIRTQDGDSNPFDSGNDWQATQTAPQGDAWTKAGFDASAWKAVKVLGPHAESPWKEIVLQDTYLDRFSVAQGFKLERIAEPKMVGTLIAMTWGNRGRLIVAQEKGPILALIDENHDGTYEKVVEYSTKVTNCQGLCMVFDDLYAAGDGPDAQHSLFRLPDANHDDVADKVELLYTFKGGIGDHGPHDIVFAPDGWLYQNLGNHSWVTQKAEPTTAVRDYYEGHLLDPRFEDAHGHAAGIKAPGGTIWRLSPDGKKWWLETAGFRNQYDFAFNTNGDMFSFDSDMEWDVGTPWYRPVRVNHCTSGAEFGWRSGTADWPEYYFDSLPTTVDIGRGSPTGVIFYDHKQLPEKYHGSFIACDWSMGRIMAVPLKSQGASFSATFETIATGNPLNVSDIEVDRDGSLVFCTGGRGTEGGVYRLSYPERKSDAESIDFNDPLTVPQIQSEWSREIAKARHDKDPVGWDRELKNAAWFGTPAKKIRALTLMSQIGPKPTGDLLVRAAQDGDASVRAFAIWLLGEHKGQSVDGALARALADSDATVRRRACEAYIRSGVEAPVEPLLKLLESNDRWLRFSARLALERVPVDKWKSRVVESQNPYVLTEGLLALFRLGKESYSPDAALEREASLLATFEKLDHAQRLSVLRMIELTLIAGGRGAVAGDIAGVLLKHFPIGDDHVDAESAKILAFLQSHDATAKIVAALQSAKSRERQIDYALTLRYLNVGWNYELKSALLDWFESTRDWEGGHSFTPFLANIVGAALERYQPAERAKLLGDWPKRAHAASLIIEKSTAADVENFDKIVASILNDRDAKIDAGRRDQLITVSIEALGRNAGPEAQASLRALFESYPDRRDVLARQLAKYPTETNWPVLVRCLSFGDTTTLQLCVRSLQDVAKQSRTADDVRAVILAALKLGPETGKNAVKLLHDMTGADHGAGDDFQKAIAFYQKWYQETFPDGVAAVLPQDDVSKTKYSYQQLADYLASHGNAGDVNRGRQIFTKAKCVRCHRFQNEGELVGPDLTTLRKRFQQKEIIESMIYPSQVISDQYRMVTVVTVDGLVHNGMPLPGIKNDDKIVLLLSDATKLEIPKSKIDDQTRSKISVMPEGILKDLTLEEIADLIAFLETSKSNEAPAQNASASASPAGGAGK